jgi:flagellar basal body-associated protein FliL
VTTQLQLIIIIIIIIIVVVVVVVVVCVALMGDRRGSYRVLKGRSEGKRPLERLRI